jgi:hypothetical protein
MNIRLPDYFKLVNFENRTPREQVKYMLFFVTEVAGLRRDMTPRIIAQRLNDQGTAVTEAKIIEIMSMDKRHFSVSPFDDRRDRLPEEIPYVISPPERKNLIKEVNLRFARMPSWKKPSTIMFLVVVAGCIIGLLSVIGWHLANRSGVDDLSWPQYKKRLKMTELPMEERAKYLLYFITVHIRLRDDMTPNVISDRLLDADLGSIAAKNIDGYFKAHPQEVIPSSNRKGAYMIAPEEARKIYSLLELKLPAEGDSISFTWIVGHVRVSAIVAFLIGYIGIVSSSIAIGHYTAKWSKIDNELLTLEE